jgi:hypothetical protein
LICLGADETKLSEDQMSCCFKEVFKFTEMFEKALQQGQSQTVYVSFVEGLVSSTVLDQKHYCLINSTLRSPYLGQQQMKVVEELLKAKNENLHYLFKLTNSPGCDQAVLSLGCELSQAKSL